MIERKKRRTNTKKKSKMKKNCEIMNEEVNIKRGGEKLNDK